MWAGETDFRLLFHKSDNRIVVHFRCRSRQRQYSPERQCFCDWQSLAYAAAEHINRIAIEHRTCRNELHAVNDATAADRHQVVIAFRFDLIDCLYQRFIGRIRFDAAEFSPLAVAQSFDDAIEGAEFFDAAAAVQNQYFRILRDQIPDAFDLVLAENNLCRILKLKITYSFFQPHHSLFVFYSFFIVAQLCG